MILMTLRLVRSVSVRSVVGLTNCLPPVLAGRGPTSQCGTGPRELRLDVIVLARGPLPRDGTAVPLGGASRRRDIRPGTGVVQSCRYASSPSTRGDDDLDLLHIGDHRGLINDVNG